MLAEFTHFSHFFENLGLDLFFNIALLLTLGMIGGKLAEMVKLPRVTGYIIIGMIFGPGGISIINQTILYDFKLFKILALGFIGFNIGLELDFTSLRKSGGHVIFITLMQTMISFGLVFMAVYFFMSEHQMTYALIFGAIATVTTPAPIVACIRSYKARGTISSYVCTMVALDDIIGIIIFSFLLPIGVYLAGHEGELITFGNLFIGPLFDIGFSLVVGGVLGYFVTKILYRHRDDDNISIVLILVTALLFGIGLGHAAETSAILLPLVIGMVMINFTEITFGQRIKRNSDAVTLPLLLFFFTLSGAELNVRLLPYIGGVGLIYIVVRVIGKMVGTYLGAVAMKEKKVVRRYLGFTLIPQGGVSLDMAILAEVRFLQIATETGNNEYAVIGSTILTVILGAIIIYKIIGEIVVKWALNKADEIPHDQENIIKHVW
jgi:NhaP-type Na+/H+ or K+/H+ antiporter